jgi:hypothetical protein
MIFSETVLLCPLHPHFYLPVLVNIICAWKIVVPGHAQKTHAGVYKAMLTYSTDLYRMGFKNNTKSGLCKQ